MLHVEQFPTSYWIHVGWISNLKFTVQLNELTILEVDIISIASISPTRREYVLSWYGDLRWRSRRYFLTPVIRVSSRDFLIGLAII